MALDPKEQCLEAIYSKTKKSNLKPFYSNASNTSFYPPFLYLNNLLFYYNWSSLLWCFGLNSLARSFQFSFVKINVSVGNYQPREKTKRMETTV